MGCGSSEPTADANIPDDGENLPLQGDWELEQGKDELKVPDILNDYPPPACAATPMHLGNIDFNKVDRRALLTPEKYANSYQELMTYLLKDFSHELLKVRAIIVWMSGQKIRTRSYPASAASDTPLGYMKLIKEKRGTFAAFFAQLCRAANMKCVIIHGICKTAAYQPGDSDLPMYGGSWNAVRVQGHWRLVHPFWVCTPRADESPGDKCIIEEGGKRYPSIMESRKGKRIFVDFFFMTDPHQLIYMCFPDNSRWQLMENVWDFETFQNAPCLRAGFFVLGYKLNFPDTCIVHSENGSASIQINKMCDENQNTDKSSVSIVLAYELYFCGSAPHIENDYGSFVFFGRRGGGWSVQVRFPVSGVYKLALYGGTQGLGTWLCDFQLICDVPKLDCKPLPIDPGDMGWGPGPESEKAGLLIPSHEDGIIPVKVNEEHTLKFHMHRNMKVTAELVHNLLKSEELAKHISHSVNNRELDVNVSVPENGEYALRLYVQGAKQSEMRNVVNYLLTDEEPRKRKLRRRESVPQRKAREKLRRAASGQKIEDLEDAVDKFVKEKLDDDDDVDRARKRLQFLRHKRNLRDAVMRRHLLTLEKTIDETRRSSYERPLEPNIRQAERLRDHLRKLDQFCHDILDMKQWTISELENYASPPPEVHKTMMATYLLLGEEKPYLDNWAHIQALLRKKHKESIISRIEMFTGEVDNATIKASQKSLRGVSEDSVRQASSGAATFHVWTTNVLTELREGTFKPRSGDDLESNVTTDR